jgi:hypothetical protein
MLTVDHIAIRAPIERVFAVAADIERWPGILAHYRWVRFLERQATGGVVEMAAWRPFGPLRYPVWWVSRMMVNRPAGEIRYRHLRGITRGMDVRPRRCVPHPGGDQTIRGERVMRGSRTRNGERGTGSTRARSSAPAPADLFRVPRSDFPV